jgi:hypothetical protein
MLLKRNETVLILETDAGIKSLKTEWLSNQIAFSSNGLYLPSTYLLSMSQNQSFYETSTDLGLSLLFDIESNTTIKAKYGNVNTCVPIFKEWNRKYKHARPI